MTAADDPTPIGYGAAAPAYWDRGWRGILPLPRGKKTPPPPGYTGHRGQDPSYPDIIAWGEEQPGANTCLHLPDTVVGIDVDGYDGRTGLACLAHAEQQWGPLPETVVSTARSEGSGIRYYQVPAGTRLRTEISFGDLGLGHIEIIQASHRYAVVWPSQHPAGGIYRWINPDGTSAPIPAPGELPTLPQRWLAELAAPVIAVADHVEPVATTGGTPDFAVAERLAQAVDDLKVAASRHDTTTRHVLALLRMAEQGHEGTASALESLGRAFVSAVTADNSRSAVAAEAEYRRMVDGQRGHQLIAATPSPAPRVREVGAAELAPAEPDPEPTMNDLVSQLTDDEFWQSNPSLTAIYEHAHEHLASPWSVLGACLARALATVPPWITLPPIIGGPGSLNCFWALVGRSGAGKGASEACAAALVPLDSDIAVWPAGSGEGLAHAYIRKATPKERDEAEAGGIIRERISAVFSVPEVDTLSSISGRQGSTIMSKLRSAYSGEEIGFAYADPTKRLLVGPHRYRMQMILGVQPERAGGLLGDTAGGTPQRFVWLPANDPSIGEVQGRAHGALGVTDRKAWAGQARHIDVPDCAAGEIRAAHIARARGEGDAIDGHALQTREKVMVGLCVLDGRTTPDDVDWLLAGKVMAVSAATRGRIEAEVAAAADRAAEVAGREWGIRTDAANLTQARRRERRIAGVVLRALERRGGSAMWSEIRRSVDSRDRTEAVEIVEELAVGGVLKLVEIDGGGRRLDLVPGVVR